MKKIVALLLLVCVMLSGCGNWLNGSYSSVEPHTEPSNQNERPVISVSNYKELRAALVSLVESGAESGILSNLYPVADRARIDVPTAVRDICENNPYAAYAVEEIQYDFGSNGGRNAISVQITYLQNRMQTDKIQRVTTLEQLQSIVSEHLDACDAGVVLYFNNPEQVDYAQMVADYALLYPQRVMEAPEVTVNLYPEQGEEQIVELKFTYRTSRQVLRNLQKQVELAFASASQKVAGPWTDTEKAQRLYDFLMERYDYNIQASITPAYSLLLHGVGDNQAFAMVYAAMCRQADVNCEVVTGTHLGEPWVWNAIQIDGTFYHLDLLRCEEENGFRLYSRDEMGDYVWDYSAYPNVQAENS